MTASQLSHQLQQALFLDPVRSDLSDRVAAAAMSLNSAGQILNSATIGPDTRAALVRHVRRLANSIEQGG